METLRESYHGILRIAPLVDSILHMMEVRIKFICGKAPSTVSTHDKELVNADCHYTY